MILIFEEWLVNQQHREDPIGELARAPGMYVESRVVSRRKVDEHKYWADIVISFANSAGIAVFNEAWQEFMLAKKTAKDAAD